MALASLLQRAGMSRNSHDVIGIHVRRGDMTADAEARVGHVPATADFILRVLHFYRGCYASRQTQCAGNLTGTLSANFFVAFILLGRLIKFNVSITRHNVPGLYITETSVLFEN